LKKPDARAELKEKILAPSGDWENLYLAAGPDNILLVGFKNEKLKPLIGKTLTEVARERDKHPIDTAMDLVIEDDSRVGTVYFMMSEDNVRKQIKLPYMSFGSDAGSMAPEGAFIKSSTHPRAYGNFARLLAKYVREENVIPLEEAIRKLTALPAENLKITDRGRLKENYFADVVVFDPATIQDHATFEKPHQYATGVIHVLVNGVPVLKNGEHTGETPGRAVRGPGYKGK
jgi:N-acyl-D-amino-acid deacylase